MTRRFSSIIFLLLLYPALCDAGPTMRLFSGAGWTPASPTSAGQFRPQHWYKADGANYKDSAGTLPATTDGDLVGRLTDFGTGLSGVSVVADANKPTLKMGVWNSKPAWRFDGSNDYLMGAFSANGTRTPSMPTSLAQPNVIFAVGNLAAAGVNDGKNQNLIDGDNTTFRNQIGQDGTPNPDSWKINGGTTLDSATPSDSGSYVWTAIFNGLNSKLYQNGSLVISGNAGVKALDGLMIGGSPNAPGTAFQWVGDISEIIIYGTTTMSSADLNQVGRYLAKKYNFTYTDIP